MDQKALKESHQDELEYHNKAIEKLNRRYQQVQRRLSILYDDKLDGKITPEFYEEKFNTLKRKRKNSAQLKDTAKPKPNTLSLG